MAWHDLESKRRGKDTPRLDTGRPTISTPPFPLAESMTTGPKSAIDGKSRVLLTDPLGMVFEVNNGILYMMEKHLSAGKSYLIASGSWWQNIA